MYSEKDKEIARDLLVAMLTGDEKFVQLQYDDAGTIAQAVVMAYEELLRGISNLNHT